MNHAPRTTAALILALALAVGCCAPWDAPRGGGTSARPSPSVIDSVFPIDVMLDRFRVDIPEARELSSGASSRDSLVERVVRALVGADTLAFEELTVDLSEWAWLYYPTSAQALPPYELPPGMAWLQVQQNNRTGVLRALQRLEGQALEYQGYSCDPDPTVEGENTIWVGCLVTLARADQGPTAIRLFSSILERNGQFAVLSYANDF